MAPSCQAPKKQSCLGRLAERRQTYPSPSVKIHCLLFIVRVPTIAERINKDVEKIVENLENLVNPKIVKVIFKMQ